MEVQSYLGGNNVPLRSPFSWSHQIYIPNGQDCNIPCLPILVGWVDVIQERWSFKESGIPEMASEHSKTARFLFTFFKIHFFNVFVGSRSPTRVYLWENGYSFSTFLNFYVLLPFNSQKLLRSPRKPTRKISKIPFKVLDAPELQDDFYLNLVDWSSLNVLSVGLGTCVYLWSACTSQVKPVVWDKSLHSCPWTFLPIERILFCPLKKSLF